MTNGAENKTDNITNDDKIKATQCHHGVNKTRRVGQPTQGHVKYALFNREDSEIWFVQLEVGFILFGITQDSTKFSHLVSNKHVLSELMNLRLTPG